MNSLSYNSSNASESQSLSNAIRFSQSGTKSQSDAFHDSVSLAASGGSLRSNAIEGRSVGGLSGYLYQVHGSSSRPQLILRRWDRSLQLFEPITSRIHKAVKFQVFLSNQKYPLTRPGFASLKSAQGLI
jgi:hypothetical protein